MGNQLLTIPKAWWLGSTNNGDGDNGSDFGFERQSGFEQDVELLQSLLPRLVRDDLDVQEISSEHHLRHAPGVLVQGVGVVTH